MSQDQPLISFIVPSYNYASFLPATLDSILSQEWPQLEIVVIDDASSDNSPQIIRDYAKQHPDKIRPILLEENGGQAAATRRAITESRGAFVSLIASDDVATPSRAREGVEYLLAHPDTMAVFSRVSFINAAGAPLPETLSPFNEQAPSDLRIRLLKGNMLCGTACVFRREVFEQYAHNPALRAVEDFDLWLRILDQHNIARVDSIWVKYRLHGNNLSLAGEKGLPLAAAAETVQVILTAMSRWLVDPSFASRFGIAQPALKHALARHCIALDRHFLGRPLLGLPKAWELMLDAIGQTPDAAEMHQTLAFIHYLLGDPARAAGGRSLPLPEWKGPAIDFNQIPLQFREEAERCRIGNLERNLVSTHASTHLEHSFLAWLASRWMSPKEQATRAPRLAPLKQTLCIVVDARHTTPTAALKATLGSLLEQPLTPPIIVRTSADSELPDTCLRASPDQSLVEVLERLPKEVLWFVEIRAGDLIDTDGVILLLEQIAAGQEQRLYYTDETLLDEDGVPSCPQFKPDFDIDHLRARPYCGRFLLLDRSAFVELQGFNESLGVGKHQDYLFRAFERWGAAAIGHLPALVFHGAPSSPVSIELLASILERHLARCSIAAALEHGLQPDSIRVRYAHAEHPLVSIIIPTKNQQPMLARCIETLTSKTAYTNYELLIVDNQSDEAEAQAYIRGIEDLNLPQIQVLHFNHPFNYSAINNFAAGKAKGDYLVLLNNDTAILDGSWLDALLNHAQRSEVGIVGAKLLFPDGRIQHGGVILGLRGPADHPFIGEPINATGYGGRLMIDQQYSAVTAACMMIRKSIFEEVGGLDEKAFKVSYNDIDLCLKVRQAGYSVIWTPYAQLMHVANVSQKAEDSAKQEAKQARFAAEQRTMYQRWMPQIKADPFYNPNFRLKGSGFELESNPVFRPMLPGLKKLLAHSGDFWGSGLYRMIAPATVLAEEGLIAGGCYREYFMPAEVAKIAPDVIVLQRQTSDEQIRGASDYRSYSNAKLIFELDDYLPNVPISNAHKKNLPPDLVRRLRKAMSICDRIVVSTDPLREAMLPFHDEIVVLPNYLPKKLWGAIPERTESDLKRKPRIGWAGGSSHTGDLRMVADVVRALADRVDWVFLGMKPEGVDEHITEFHVGVPLGEYPAKLAALDLDLALAPLEENQFNECKSNLRLLEYGICGYPVIATDVTPYRCGFPVTLVRNRFKDWVEAIQTKLEDRDALWQEGIALQRFVREGWMLEGENLLRWRDGWMLGD